VHDLSTISSTYATRKLFSYEHLAGVLDACVDPNDTTVYSAGCDNQIQACDMATAQTLAVGNHLKPVRCLQYCDAANVLISGSWDKNIKLWDLKNNQEIASYEMSNKVFSLDILPKSYQLVVGIAGRQILIYDIRNMSEPQQKRESSLKHQTRKIVCHPNSSQFVVSSIEGRVAVEYFDPSPEIQAKKYAFKCHRVIDKASNTQTIYPVNAIAFHPIFETFATGGGDGVVNIWDGNNKKRICQFPAYMTSIASLDFNRDGSLIAVAASYTWEQGSPTRKIKDSVWIRKMKETEAQPKLKSSRKET
jgi:cell cycle arrest protein BUB3